MACQESYTGAIVQPFGENRITHNCSCASTPGASADAGIPLVWFGLAAGVIAALFLKGVR